MKNWNQYSKPCLHPSTETRVCEGQIPLMFQRNGVCICWVYAAHMLMVYRIGILDVQNQQILNRGIQPAWFLHMQHVWMLNIFRFLLSMEFRGWKRNVPILVLQIQNGSFAVSQIHHLPRTFITYAEHMQALIIHKVLVVSVIINAMYDLICIFQ